MRFSSLFGISKRPQQVAIGCDSLSPQPAATGDSLSYPHPTPQPVSGQLSLSQPISAKIEFPSRAWFLPTQIAWLEDSSSLRIWEKSRQVGATKTDAFDSVLKAS